MTEEFFPVPLKSIVVDSVPDFDLFITDLYVKKEDYELYEQYREQFPTGSEVDPKAQGYEGIFVDQTEVERHHEIVNNYHSINSQILVEGMEIDFPLYAHVPNEVNFFPEMESKPEGPWELTSDICSFKQEIMVRKTDLPKYRAFVEKMMASGSGGDQAATEHRATALREMSKMVVRDVLDDPRARLLYLHAFVECLRPGFGTRFSYRFAEVSRPGNAGAGRDAPRHRKKPGRLEVNQ